MGKNSKAFNLQLISDNTNQVFKNLVDAISGNSKSKQHNRNKHKWVWYMNFIQWYTNSYDIFDCDELKKLKGQIAEKLFWYGSCGIIKFGDSYVCVGLKDVKRGLDNYITKATASINEDVIEATKIDTKLTRKNCVFIQSNVYTFPYFWNLDIFLDPIFDLWDIIPEEIENAIVKIIFQVSDDKKERDSLLKEVEAMYSRRKSLVSVISGNLGKEIILENKTITDELQELFKFYRNYMFNMTGRLYNASEKRERNITSEVAINSLQFDVVHNDFMFYLEKSINDFNQLFGENASIKTLKDINSEKEMEMQAMNMLHQGVDKEEGNKDE